MRIYQLTNIFKQKPISVVLFLAMQFFMANANAVIVEGTAKGFIDFVHVEGNRSGGEFFDAAGMGKEVSIDFWYEFDGTNFPPTDSSAIHRVYDFGLTDMGITFNIGQYTLATPVSHSTLPLNHYRNSISIARTQHFSYFTVSTYTEHSTEFWNYDRLGVEVSFGAEAMEYFNEFDLVQNLSMTAPANAHYGSFELLHFIDDHGYMQDIYITGVFNEFSLKSKQSANVDEPSILWLLMVGLAAFGYRFLLVGRCEV